MNTNDALKQSLEHYKQQRQKLRSDLSTTDTMIRQLQIDLGETPDEAGWVSRPDVSVPPTSEGPPTLSSGSYNPRPDEFFGMSQSDAAKAFLEKIGHAISLDNLVNGLKSGGCKVGGADPKRTLYISLVRNVREFVPVGSGFIGLRKFYPGATPKPRKRGKDESGRTVTRKKRTKQTVRARAISEKPKRLMLASATHSKSSAGQIKELVWKIMGDHALRTPDELHHAVKVRALHPVKKVAVFGALRSKEFEQVGDKYKLRRSADELPLQ